MKLPLSRFSRSERRDLRLKKKYQWHQKFAWRPVIIPEQRYEEIVVPRHLLWLEKFECRGYGDAYTFWRLRQKPKYYEKRTYRGAPTLHELVHE